MDRRPGQLGRGRRRLTGELEEERLEVGPGFDPRGEDARLGERAVDVRGSVRVELDADPARPGVGHWSRGPGTGQSLRDGEGAIEIARLDPDTDGPLAGEQFIHGPFADELAAGDDPDDLGQLAHLAEDVARDEDRPPRGCQPPERVAHGDDARRIEAVGRLVEEQEAWIAQEGRGDAEPLLHPERVRVHAVTCPVDESHELEELLDPLPRRRSPRRGDRTEVLATGQERIEGRRLDEGADLEQPPTVSASERPAEQLDAARVGMDEPREDAHRRRLAGTVRAQEAVHDASRDREIQTVERDHLAVALDEPAGGERQAILGGGRHAPASG